MNTIDLMILIIVGFFCVKGFFRGMILEIFTLIGLLIAYVIALREMSTVAHFVNRIISVPLIIGNSLGFLLIFVFILLLFRWIAIVIRRVVKWSFLGWVDRGGGMALGIFKGTFITSLLALLISLIPLSEKAENMQKQSLLFHPIRSVAPAVFNFLKSTFPKTKNFYEEVREGFSSTSSRLIDQIVTDQFNSLLEETEDGDSKQGNQ
ncbi:CvpA family protein [bacterium]|nr:CvpA family protein [bacterium]